MLDSESSLRLNLIRFPLIVGVVFIHANSSALIFSGDVIGVKQTNFVTSFAMHFVSNEVAGIAVPLFFLISGYLFFSGFEWSKEKYLLKLRTRTRTLLVPFLFWNIAMLSIVAIAQALPTTKTYFSGLKSPIASFSVFDYLNAIIGFNGLPIAYQFWFIRDLMILVLLVPLINSLNKIMPFLFLLIVFMCWFFGIWPLYTPGPTAVLFFCVGVYLSSTNKSLFAVDKYGLIIVLLYFPIAVVFAIPTFNSEPVVGYLARINLILGISAALFLTKYVAKNKNLKSLFIWLGSASFFVYATHEPLLIILRKVVYKAINPDSSFLVLTLYFLLPIVVITFSLVAYHFLCRVLPRFTSIVTGGRSQQLSSETYNVSVPSGLHLR